MFGIEPKVWRTQWKLDSLTMIFCLNLLIIIPCMVLNWNQSDDITWEQPHIMLELKIICTSSSFDVWPPYLKVLKMSWGFLNTRSGYFTTRWIIRWAKWLHPFISLDSMNICMDLVTALSKLYRRLAVPLAQLSPFHDTNIVQGKGKVLYNLVLVSSLEVH